MKFLLSLFIIVSASLAHAEVHKGKASSGALCSVRMELNKELIDFAGDGTAFGFMVPEKVITDALKKGQRMVTLTANDGPISARLSLSFSSTGNLESASFFQKSFRSIKRVKCQDLVSETRFTNVALKNPDIF